MKARKPLFRSPGQSSLWASTALLSLSALASPLATAQASDPVVFVLDGSNSMWGQMDGEPKISIARSAFSELLDELSETKPVGLVSYGHRRAGDCADIEVMSPVATGNRDALKKSVSSVTPRGKTPITTALQKAADSLPGGGSGSIVLLSDGIETCKGDPCALAESLKAKNVDFTVHVIGVDIRKPEDKAALACIADRTGGTYTDVSEADQLGPALENSAANAGNQDVIQRIPYTLEAIDGIEGPVIHTAEFDILSATDETVIATGIEGSYDFLPGDYIIIARSDDRVGTLETRILKDAKGEVITVVIDAALPTATLAFDSPAVASSLLEVSWEGPDGTGDYIEVLAPNGERLEDTYFVYTADGSPSLIRLPSEPGQYSLRYVYASRNAELVTMPLTVTPALASIAAPAEAEVGTEVSVTWEGPDGDSDFIGVFRAGEADASDVGYGWTRNGNPLEIRMPGDVGDYELRYVTGNDRSVLAAVPIRLVSADGAITAPDEIEAGMLITAEIEGNFDGGRDYLTVAPADADDSVYMAYRYLDPEAETSVRVPTEAGAYELRIVREASDGNQVLHRRPLTVLPSRAQLSAPSSVSAGSSFSVTPTGPALPGYGDDVYVTITLPDEGEGSYSQGYDYVAVSGEPITLTAPDEPGTYELRYITVSNVPGILVRQTLTVR